MMAGEKEQNTGERRRVGKRGADRTDGKEKKGQREIRERDICSWRGGGLGSRPIFKKFHETYAPS